MSSIVPPYAVFYSYAREDLLHLAELRKQLIMLQREKFIEEWYDGKLVPGEKWNEIIRQQCAAADIMLCLISSDFFNSEYSWNTEVRLALDARLRGTLEIIPIIVRPVDWEHSIFGTLQVLPSGAKPITEWPSMDGAWLDVAKGLRRTVNNLAHKRLTQRIANIAPGLDEQRNRASAQYLAEDVPKAFLNSVISELSACFCRMQEEPFVQYRIAQALAAAGATEDELQPLFDCALHPLARRGLEEAAPRGAV